MDYCLQIKAFNQSINLSKQYTNPSLHSDIAKKTPKKQTDNRPTHWFASGLMHRNTIIEALSNVAASKRQKEPVRFVLSLP